MPKIKLLKKCVVADGTMEFFFQKPKGFQFKAGQYLDYTLINPPETDAEGDWRSFTIAAAPFEKDIIITTRMRDTAFKRVLKSMPFSSQISIQGPHGNFTLHKDVTKPAVFLAGGIGITPFRSMIVQATRDKLPHRIYLFYSNRRPKDTAFLTEFQQLVKENPGFNLIPTMTDYKKPNKDWKGEIGYIDQPMLGRFIPNYLSPVYYLCGPPAFITAMKQILRKMGVNKKSIRMDEFYGY